MIVVLSVLTASNYLVYWFYPSCETPDSLSKCLSLILILIVGFINLSSSQATDRLHQICNYFKIGRLPSFHEHEYIFTFHSSLAFDCDCCWFLSNDFGSSGELCWTIRGFDLFRARERHVCRSLSILRLVTWWQINLLPPCHRCFSLFRNYLNNAIDDLKDPKRILPRSIVISLLICIFVYFLTFSSYFTALSPYEILMSEATAVTFAERVFPPLLYLIPIGVTMSCVGGKHRPFERNSSQCFPSYFSGIGKHLYHRKYVQRYGERNWAQCCLLLFTERLSISFVVAGRDGLMPHIFSMKHYQTNVPMIAILCEVILSIIFLFFMSNVRELIICVGMINWICKTSYSPSVHTTNIFLPLSLDRYPIGRYRSDCTSFQASRSRTAIESSVGDSNCVHYHFSHSNWQQCNNRCKEYHDIVANVVHGDSCLHDRRDVEKEAEQFNSPVQHVCPHFTKSVSRRPWRPYRLEQWRMKMSMNVYTLVSFLSFPINRFLSVCACASLGMSNRSHVQCRFSSSSKVKARLLFSFPDFVVFLIPGSHRCYLKPLVSTGAEKWESDLLIKTGPYQNFHSAPMETETSCAKTRQCDGRRTDPLGNENWFSKRIFINGCSVAERDLYWLGGNSEYVERKWLLSFLRLKRTLSCLALNQLLPSSCEHAVRAEVFTKARWLQMKANQLAKLSSASCGEFDFFSFFSSRQVENNHKACLLLDEGE